MKKLNVRILAALLAAAALIFTAGCSAALKIATDAAQNESGYSGSTSGKGGMYDYSDVDPVAPNATESYNAVSDLSAPVDDTRKIIKTVSLNLETREFETAVKELVSMTESAGGYIESSYVSGRSYNDYGNITRSATYTLRVPAGGLDAYVGALSNSFNVLSRQDSSSDITDSYFDAKARLDSLITQEERLLAMLEGANELEYMLKLEDKLSEVRYQIESFNSTLQRYDKSVSMATINVSLQEVVEYKKIIEQPKTFSERLYISFTESWSDFADGFQDFAVGLVYSLPTLIVIAVIVGVAGTLTAGAVKRRNRRRREAHSEDINNSTGEPK